MSSRKTRPLSDRARRDATDAILDRRRRLGDPDLEKASDHPVELVTYVLEHQRVSRKAIGADLLDALVVLEGARRQAQQEFDRLEHLLLEQGITAGLSLTELGVPVGGLGKSTIHNRLLRGRARQAGLASNEKALRAQQRGDRWLAVHGKRLLAAAHHLPAHAERVAEHGDEDFADGLTELAESLATLSAAATDPAQPIPAADITRMRFIAARLRVILHEITAPHLAPPTR
ncbi:hypothetical protein [Streptosporangium sp. H16]|uniref:hypothetical protein n=1 Tax=Streptosporangium sp. H16 TaxID=3444184 RepID=UPI003F7A9D72